MNIALDPPFIADMCDAHVDLVIATQLLVMTFRIKHFMHQELDITSGSFVLWHGSYPLRPIV